MSPQVENIGRKFFLIAISHQESTIQVGPPDGIQGHWRYRSWLRHLGQRRGIGISQLVQFTPGSSIDPTNGPRMAKGPGMNPGSHDHAEK